MRDRAIIISLLLTGLLLRVVGLESVPPGLWSDEANHGLEANDIVRGKSAPLFFPGNCGQEPLFKFLVAALTALFGPGVFTLRLAAALSGWLLLPLTWVFARRLRGEWFAFLSLVFLTFGVWHLHFSRLAFRAILGPTLGLLALLAADSARTHRSAVRGIIAGIIAASLWYTYPAFRLMSLVPFLWLLLALWREDGLWRTVALFVIAFVLSLCPLVWAWKDHPELFTARASMAAIWSETPDLAQGIIRNTVKHLGMFLFSGDPNWRHNLSGAPQLDVVTGFFFLIGFACALARRTRFDLLLLLWAGLMLIPGILSVERQAPHCLRTLGVLPVPYLFAAQGFLWLKERTGTGSQRGAVLVVLLLLVPVLTLSRYFVAWPAGLSTLKAEEESLFGFNRQEYALGQWLKGEDRSNTVWLSPQLFLHPTTAYTAQEADYRLLRNVRSLQDEDLVVLQLSERNLWWLRDDFRKNFFIWWWQNGRATERMTWEALMWAYPHCAYGMTRGSDQWILASLKRGGAYDLVPREPVAGLLVAEVRRSMSQEHDMPVWPANQWRRLPAGCFSVTVDSIHAGTSSITLVSKEEESSKSWILDSIDSPHDSVVTMQGCLLFPSCARIQSVGEDGVLPIGREAEWAYDGPPDLEPYFRRTLWGKMRALWARVRLITGL